MQPLERYGVIALLFLAVATVAVFLWNDDSSAEAAAGGGFLATAPPARQGTPPALKTQIAAGEQEPRSLNRQARPAIKDPTPEELAEQDRQERLRRMADFSARNRASGSQSGKANAAATGALGAQAGRSGSPKAQTVSSAKDTIEWGNDRRRSGKGNSAAASKHAPSRSKTQVRVPDEKQAREAGAPSRIARSEQPKATGGGKSSGSATLAAVLRPGEYIIQSGDTLTGISQQALGRASRWKEIVALNANLNPDRLVVGTKIQLPGDAETPQSTRPAQPSGGGSYVIRSGDSLWGIAQAELGDGGRWREILSVNPGLNADKLVVGRKLLLPSGQAPQRSTKVAQASPKASRRGGVR